MNRCVHGTRATDTCAICDRRDRFATAALTGLLAYPRDDDEVIAPEADDTVPQYFAKAAAAYADATIAELDKTAKP